MKCDGCRTESCDGGCEWDAFLNEHDPARVRARERQRERDRMSYEALRNIAESRTGISFTQTGVAGNPFYQAFGVQPPQQPNPLSGLGIGNVFGGIFG